MANDFSNFLHDALDLVEHTSIITEFYHRFEAIRYLVQSSQPWLPESYFSSRFIYGLQEEFQIFVIRFQPVTVIDAFYLACICEYSLGTYLVPSRQKTDEYSIPFPTMLDISDSNVGNDISVFLHYALDKLQQNSSLDEFYHQFEALRSIIASIQPWLPESYFTDRFIYGLCEELQCYVIQFHPCTISDAYCLAAIYEYDRMPDDCSYVIVDASTIDMGAELEKRCEEPDYAETINKLRAVIVSELVTNTADSKVVTKGAEVSMHEIVSHEKSQAIYTQDNTRNLCDPTDLDVREGSIVESMVADFSKHQHNEMDATPFMNDTINISKELGIVAHPGEVINSTMEKELSVVTDNLELKAALCVYMVEKPDSYLKLCSSNSVNESLAYYYMVISSKLICVPLTMLQILLYELHKGVHKYLLQFQSATHSRYHKHFDAAHLIEATKDEDSDRKFFLGYWHDTGWKFSVRNDNSLRTTIQWTFRDGLTQIKGNLTVVGWVHSSQKAGQQVSKYFSYCQLVVWNFDPGIDDHRVLKHDLLCGIEALYDISLCTFTLQIVLAIQGLDLGIISISPKKLQMLLLLQNSPVRIGYICALITNEVKDLYPVQSLGCSKNAGVARIGIWLYDLGIQLIGLPDNALTLGIPYSLASSASFVAWAVTICSSGCLKPAQNSRIVVSFADRVSSVTSCASPSLLFRSIIVPHVITVVFCSGAHVNNTVMRVCYLPIMLLLSQQFLLYRLTHPTGCLMEFEEFDNASLPKIPVGTKLLVSSEEDDTEAHSCIHERAACQIVTHAAIYIDLMTCTEAFCDGLWLYKILPRLIIATKEIKYKLEVSIQLFFPVVTVDSLDSCVLWMSLYEITSRHKFSHLTAQDTEFLVQSMILRNLGLGILFVAHVHSAALRLERVNEYNYEHLAKMAFINASSAVFLWVIAWGMTPCTGCSALGRLGQYNSDECVSFGILPSQCVKSLFVVPILWRIAWASSLFFLQNVWILFLRTCIRIWLNTASEDSQTYRKAGMFFSSGTLLNFLWCIAWTLNDVYGTLHRIITTSQSQQFKYFLVHHGMCIYNKLAVDVCLKSFLLSVSRPADQSQFYMLPISAFSCGLQSVTLSSIDVDVYISFGLSNPFISGLCYLAMMMGFSSGQWLKQVNKHASEIISTPFLKNTSQYLLFDAFKRGVYDKDIFSQSDYLKGRSCCLLQDLLVFLRNLVDVLWSIVWIRGRGSFLFALKDKFIFKRWGLS